MSKVKTEKGYIIENDGKYWGKIYNDSKSDAWGWVNMEDAEVFDSISKPEDITHTGSWQYDEIVKGKLVGVTKETKIYFCS